MKNFDYKYYLTFLSAFLIVLGSIKFIIYYSLFGVNITQFLDLSEVLILFLDDILFFSLILIFYLGTDFIFRLNEDIEFGKENFNKSLKEKKFTDRLKLYFQSEIKILFFFGASLGWIVLWFALDMDIFYLKAMLIYLWGLFFVRILLLEIRRKYNKSINILHTDILTLLYLYLGFSIYSAYSDFHNVKMYSGTSIVLSEENYISNESYYYIGKTKNYTFFYNKKNEACDVFPNSEIKKFTLKKEKLHKKI